MQRSKQQALMFLLGAVLVGGVLGFSADRVMTSKKKSRPSPRMSLYQEIGFDSLQIAKADSVLEETNCKTSEFLRPFRPSMDSIRAEGRSVMLGLMNQEQRARFDAREKRMRASMDSLERHRDSVWAAKNPGTERPRRCGGTRQGGSSSGGDRSLRPLL